MQPTYSTAIQRLFHLAWNTGEAINHLISEGRLNFRPAGRRSVGTLVWSLKVCWFVVSVSCTYHISLHEAYRKPSILVDQGCKNAIWDCVWSWVVLAAESPHKNDCEASSYDKIVHTRCLHFIPVQLWNTSTSRDVSTIPRHESAFGTAAQKFGKHSTSGKKNTR